MKRIAKRILCIIVIIAAIPLLIGIVLSSPMVYIHNKLGVWCVLPPLRTYHYDAIGHGKDYNSLAVFSLSKFDAKRLTSSIADIEGWQELPLDQDAMRFRISDVSFDSKMSELLYKQVGYWYIDDTEHDLYVLDLEDNDLYIRTASVIQ